MSKQQEQLEAISEIRSLMERSSRFLSLSGLAGVVVGVIALAGVASAYIFLGLSPLEPGYYNRVIGMDGEANAAVTRFFFLVPAVVLVL